MSVPIDVQRARDETPGCNEVAHFNNAGSALMPKRVYDTVVDHLALEYRIGGYEAAARRRVETADTYSAIAELIGARPDEIALVENATRAWDMAFYGFKFSPGDRILTAVSEYASNYIAFLQVAKKTGVEIIVVPNDEHGALSVDHLKELIDDRVKLIAVTHVPTNGGLVNPAAEIGAVARDAGIPYILDACQSVGQMPIDVTEIGCDVLSATGRKFLRGPRGTGFLYVSNSCLDKIEPPLLDLHAAEWTSPDSYQMVDGAKRFENWEGYVAGRLGLGAAVRYAMEWGMENICDRVFSLAAEMRAFLAGLPGVTIRDLGSVRCGIVSFTVDGLEASKLAAALVSRAVNVSYAEESHTRLDMEPRGIDTMIRASVHYYNTSDEIARLCEEVEAIATRQLGR